QGIEREGGEGREGIDGRPECARAWTSSRRREGGRGGRDRRGRGAGNSSEHVEEEVNLFTQRRNGAKKNYEAKIYFAPLRLCGSSSSPDRTDLPVSDSGGDSKNRARQPAELLRHSRSALRKYRHPTSEHSSCAQRSQDCSVIVCASNRHCTASHDERDSIVRT